MKPTAILLAFLFFSACDGSADVPGAGSKLTPVAGQEQEQGQEQEAQQKPLLSGTVFDEAGHPVAGVAVQVFTPIRINERQSLSSLTDAAGRFEFDVEGELGIVQPIPLFLDLRKDWFLPAQHQLSPWRRGRPKSVDIPLSPAGAVTGRVLDDDGRLVAGAFVFAIPPDIPGAESRERVPSTVTDAEGRFRLQGLPIRGMDIGVLAEGYTQALKGPANVLANVDVPFGSISLSPGGRIAGEVRTLDGRPIQGAVVYAYRKPELRDYELFGRLSVKDAGATVRTDTDGRFDITTLSPGSYTVETEAPGHRVGASSVREVSPDRTDLVLTLEPIRTIELTVLDAASQQPVPTYDVTLVTESMEMKPVRRDEIRSRDGIFKFVVSEGATYRMTITAEGYVEHEKTFTVTGDFDRSLRVGLKKR